jgi:hypothetical protein
MCLPGIGVEDKCGGVDGGWESNEGTEGPDGDQGDHHNHLGGFRGERAHDSPPPVQGDGQHGEDAGRDRGEGDELVERAVKGAKVPNSKFIIKVKMNREPEFEKCTQKCVIRKKLVYLCS